MGRNEVETLHRAEYHRLLAMLREARSQANVTQGELARRVGVPQPRMSAIESGSRRLDAIELLDILRALGVGPAEFFGRLDEETRPGSRRKAPEDA